MLAGGGVRAVASLGFRPALWFNDAFEYVGVALRFEPDPSRPIGYSAFLAALEPLHSFALVVATQHLMGIGVAVLLYTLLCRWGMAPWLATVAVLAPLLDGNQIQLEHLVLSDTLFTALLVSGIVVVLWSPPVSTRAAAVAGLLLACATLVRSIGLPMLALVGLWLIVRRVGWRRVAAFGGVALLPLLGYASWFKATHGQFTLTTSDGIFLYGRVAIFADCAKIDPPQRLRVLCESRPPSERTEVSTNYIWHPSPLNNLPGVQKEPLLPMERFAPNRNDPAGEFARMAILAQPGDYVRTAWHDVLRTFPWEREPFPSAAVEDRYHFSDETWPITERVYATGGTADADTTTYERGAADTRLVQPWADWVIQYQRIVSIRGPILAAMMVVGLVGLVIAFVRQEQSRWSVALVYAVAIALVVLPPFTAQFDHRYVLPAVPLTAVVAMYALAIARHKVPSTTSIMPTDSGLMSAVREHARSAATDDDKDAGEATEPHQRSDDHLT